MHIQTADDVIVGQTREKVTEFVYDYSYWSVDPHDQNFIPQEQVVSCKVSLNLPCVFFLEMLYHPVVLVSVVV